MLLVVTEYINYKSQSDPPDLVIKGLHPAIHVRGWRYDNGEPFCNKVVRCGPLVVVSCRPETDGELTYYDNTNGKRLMECGGYPGTPGAICPPPGWTCAPP